MGHLNSAYAYNIDGDPMNQSLRQKHMPASKLRLLRTLYKLHIIRLISSRRTHFSSTSKPIYLKMNAFELLKPCVRVRLTWTRKDDFHPTTKTAHRIYRWNRLHQQKTFFLQSKAHLLENECAMVFSSRMNELVPMYVIWIRKEDEHTKSITSKSKPNHHIWYTIRMVSLSRTPFSNRLKAVYLKMSALSPSAVNWKSSARAV